MKNVPSRVLAFAASSSRQSINKQLVKHAASMLNDIEIDLLDINDFEMPIYSSDREQEFGIPQQAKDFFQRITDADGVMISFAEHNGSYTAAYKNLFDWASRIDMKVFQGKPVLYLATSPGPGGASSVLGAAVNSAPYFGAEVKAHLSVPSFYDNFDMENQRLKEPNLADKLMTAMMVLQSNLN